jgi:arginine decarboxylase
VTVIDLSRAEQVGADSRASIPRLRTIDVACAIGTGATTLSAFDDALLRNGIGNFNLIRLSSVIPPGTDVVRSPGRLDVEGDWGDRLYVVMAEERVERVGREAWAGIGWVQNEETGRGLFVEHEGNSEEQLYDDLERSLASLVAARPGNTFGPVQTMVTGGRCDGEPMCAMVVAVYEAESWTIDLRGRN